MNVIRLPDWPALRAACALAAWQRAYAAAGPCPGKDGNPAALAAWRRAAEYIETEKARDLAALTATWRANKEQARVPD